MGVLAGIAEQQSERLKQYRPVQTVHEFQKILLQELDFSRELQSMQWFRKTFADQRGIRFAEPYPKLSSRRVLTMERFEGISLSDKSELERSGVDLNDIAKRGANLFIKMIFRDGFYHADPHPGNLIVLSGRIVTDSGEIAELFGFSVPGFLGCSIAFLMGMQISLAIRRSGTK